MRNFGIQTSVDGGEFKIVSNAGLINVEAMRALKYLSESYTTKGETGMSEQCLDIAKLWFVTITGSELGLPEFFKS